MPLITQEDYERLGEHLCAIDAPLASFAAAHGYTVYPPLSGGRYPNRRITQEGRLLRNIHITMDLTPSGEPHDHFFEQIPTQSGVAPGLMTRTGAFVGVARPFLLRGWLFPVWSRGLTST